jgi:hypothetical protein
VRIENTGENVDETLWMLVKLSADTAWSKNGIRSVFHAFPFILWKVSCGYGLQNDVVKITDFDGKARIIFNF